MQDIIQGLHPLERKIIPFLKNTMLFQELLEQTKMQEAEVMRALQWMENKELLKIKTETKETITFGDLGKKYSREGLPERRLLEQLKKKTLTIQEIKLEDAEKNIAIGELKKKAAISLGKEIEITEQGKKLLEKEFPEEKFLKSLPKEPKSLSEEEKRTFESLKKRKDIIQINIEKTRTITLTELGKKLLKEKIDVNLLETLSHDLLKTGKWQGKKFRKYDVKINVPKIYGGRRQPYMEFLNKIKVQLVQLGFKEMSGPLIETEFYNFDVLFQPQDHPARTWTDTYHLKYPTQGKLPNDLVVNRVKNVHQDGGRTGSTGWGYKWDPKIAMQLMPRAHATAVSARQMVKGIENPCKYFTISRVYRPDVLDATHLIEFNQLDGFVTDKSISFRTLLGMLKLFAIEIAGAEEVKFFADYYPFTEPSVQISAKHPQLGWVELGGAGIFRPEITETLNIETPVMAWGLGIDRLAMFKLGIKDIRYLFSQDLKWLREPRIV
ncbi:MAG: phenylalanyl-tRNA synthetase alpha chain [archaeon GW2011_AR17]|nr:MAG: phenylalanyl-tRNA synthetase alpha chain [archaeon GW2011_AR17]MBS3154706.1 phenylalanine--tRNA ligase subunit alpha [Candidatus Woesearchaeota archaeon]HIH15737.1 phenylalanine--tRNA ligase subunit alpha [Nanoarchaeota archaeon]HIH58451.1 phenylalanine--tRNA ligase subunit alpha [Nanoarchaeota archaeon]HII13699.1 phenylalanine--tRNA ligase subunit alpha [Nanoarchaeota archaeon]